MNRANIFDSNHLDQELRIAKRDQRDRSVIIYTPGPNLPRDHSFVTQGSTPLTTPSIVSADPFSSQGSSYLNTPPQSNPAGLTNPPVVPQYGSSRSEPGVGTVYIRNQFDDTAMTEANDHDVTRNEEFMKEAMEYRDCCVEETSLARQQIEFFASLPSQREYIGPQYYPDADNSQQLMDEYRAAPGTSSTSQEDTLAPGFPHRDEPWSHLNIERSQYPLDEEGLAIASDPAEGDIYATGRSQYSEGSRNQPNIHLAQHLHETDGNIYVSSGPGQEEVHESGIQGHDVPLFTHSSHQYPPEENSFTPVPSGPRQEDFNASVPLRLNGESRNPLDIQVNPHLLPEQERLLLWSTRAELGPSGLHYHNAEGPWSALNMHSNQREDGSTPVRSGPTQETLSALNFTGHNHEFGRAYNSRFDQNPTDRNQFTPVPSGPPQDDVLVPDPFRHNAEPMNGQNDYFHLYHFGGNQPAPFLRDLVQNTRRPPDLNPLLNKYHQMCDMDSAPHQVTHPNMTTPRSRPGGQVLGQTPTFNLIEPTSEASDGRAHEFVAIAENHTIKRYKGRRHGPLTPNRRARAGERRKKGSCWHCKLQRNECEYKNCPSQCEGCRKTQNWPWGCTSLHLKDLTNVILPVSLLDQHQSEEKLRDFVHCNIRRWTANSMHIDLTWGHAGLIGCDVYEFVPKGDYLRMQDQYRLDRATGEWTLFRVPSVHLGMKQLLRSWGPKFLSYLDDTIDSNEFRNFPRHCFQGDENEVQRNLTSLVHDYYLTLPKKVGVFDPSWSFTDLPKEKRCPKNCLKVIICTQIMTRTLTLVERNKGEVSSKLSNPPEPSVFEIHTGMRLLNKQVKYVISKVHQFLVKTLLEDTQKVLQSSKKGQRWGQAFINLLTLSMVSETLQHHIRCKEMSEKGDVERASLRRENEISKTQEQEQAEIAVMTEKEATASTIRRIGERAQDEIMKMEEKLKLVRGFFHWKYSRQDINAHGFNPVFQDEHGREVLDGAYYPPKKESGRVLLDESSQRLAEGVQTVIENQYRFLEARKMLGPPTGPRDPHTSRLVAEFLAVIQVKLG